MVIERRAFTLGLLAAALARTAGAATAAPAFTLPLLQGGQAFDSKALIGQKVLVVRFQASF